MKIEYRYVVALARAGMIGITALMAVSCASMRDMNYEAYQKLPVKPSSLVNRTVAMSNAFMRNRAFYENYGGPGSRGGIPSDETDDLYRRHDIVYLNAKSQRIMTAADVELVKRLKLIDEDSLSLEAQEYRERAIGFMESRMAGLIGKPFMARLRVREPKGSYFPDEESVERFFAPSHSGFP